MSDEDRLTVAQVIQRVMGDSSSPIAIDRERVQKIVENWGGDERTSLALQTDHTV